MDNNNKSTPGTEVKVRVIKPEIIYNDFMKADIRMCFIDSVEKVEGTDKLYKLEINTGIDTRIVVSAIAHKFKPIELIGEIFPFILNLPPREIKGIKSCGMIILMENLLPLQNHLAKVGDILI